VSVRDRADENRDELVVAALHRLAPHLDGEPDPAFRAATRARLVAMAAVRSPEPEPVFGLKRLLAGRAIDATPSRWRTRFTAGLAGAALTVTAAASLVALADGARPGDVLYGLKRGTEQTQLALAGDARGRTLLGFASTRLDELQDLIDESATALPTAGEADAPGGTVLAAGADPELVISTLETMDDQTTEGTAWLTDRAVTTADDAPLDDLSVWAASQADGLAALAPELPAAAGAAVSHSLTLLSDVSARTDGLQVALDCPAGPAVGRADALGPVPAPCVPAATGTPGQAGSGVPGSGSATGTVPPTGATPTLPGGGTSSGDAASSGSGGGTAVPVPGTPTIPGGPGLPTIPGGLTPSLPRASISLPGTSASVQPPSAVPNPCGLLPAC
jgi:hypothetical protein